MTALAKQLSLICHNKFHLKYFTVAVPGFDTFFECSLLCIQSHCENNIPRALPTNVLASSLLCPVTASGRRSTEAMGTLQATMTTAKGPKPRKVRMAVASYGRDGS